MNKSNGRTFRRTFFQQWTKILVRIDEQNALFEYELDESGRLKNKTERQKKRSLKKKRDADNKREKTFTNIKNLEADLDFLILEDRKVLQDDLINNDYLSIFSDSSIMQNNFLLSDSSNLFDIPGDGAMPDTSSFLPSIDF